MSPLRWRHAVLLAGMAMISLTDAAVAQSAAEQPSEPDPAVAPKAEPEPAAAGQSRTFVPADFVRFAPRTAYDMLKQVPGFTIRSVNVEDRGLGQASENILINRERIANKQGGAADELQRIPAGNVERIEIVDASSLGIAGLSGQVANVIVKASKAGSGQFEWNPEVRAHFAKPRLYDGSISYRGATGPLDYTLSVKNSSGRGGFGGEILIYDRNETLTERRNEDYHSEYEAPTFKSKFGIDGPGSSVGNLSLAYTPYWNPSFREDRREPLAGDFRTRITENELKGWWYDVNGDWEFGVGPGRLKLIGLAHRKREPLVTTQITTFDSGAPSTGTRFDRDTTIVERVGRAEYAWKGGRNNWQVSVERAFNSLDQKGRLFDLDPSGAFVEQDYPEGSGLVEELRYEAIGTWSRPITDNLDLQLAAGAEISRLARVDSDIPARKFFRPKGSLTLGWRPAENWDASLKINRRVGQISFYDFLSQPNLSSDRESAGNPDLVPPQSWEFEGEVGRNLGPWGKTRLRGWYHRVEDIVDYIPLPNNGQGVGNLPRASKFGGESTSTFQFDPIGWQGAKLDLTAGFEHTGVKDPLTGERRPISSTRDRWFSVSLRHDIPKSDIAWGAYADHSHYVRTFFLTEVYRSWEGPVWAGLFIEHKNVFGLTVRADANNLLNARHRWTRFVYTDWRDRSPIDYIQRNNQLIGPIFSLSVKGTF
ncbi:TonB-dependent receptor [Sphingomonas lutea]|uniref:TonB-dependent receptor n=1 Tax=Sphingomonas lutea TaxID=1045317 RepID=A0A7G9SG22_9SPHN|nr:TonB-dependent receptor [Sphingomonas lutea]QNN66797.1 TonB-dependent receptor [Sphingomonas lutea]